MKTNYIDFKKKRELGDILTDTFAFLRTQFKPFFTTFFKIVGPYLFAMVITLGLYMYFVGDFLTSIILNNAGFNQTSILSGAVIAIIYFASLIAVYTMSHSTTLYYIESYIDGKGEIDFNTIKSNVYKSFWSFIGLSILVGICVVAGFMFCIIPGVYLLVPLSLAFSILVYQKKGATDSFSDSFGLVKDEWWMTFATIFVVGIIVVVAGYAFAIPTILYQWMKMGILAVEIDPENYMDAYTDPISILLNVFNTMVQFLLNLISVIAGALIYFNLNEKKNFTGTFERIQNLGKTPEN